MRHRSPPRLTISTFGGATLSGGIASVGTQGASTRGEGCRIRLVDCLAMLLGSHAVVARPVARTVATVAVLVAARGLDALSTWIATHDLSLETNPLTRFLHVGWGGLLAVNALAYALVFRRWRSSVFSTLP